jgi:hypothetical protein
MSNSGLLEELRGRELRGGGWSFFGARQVSLEATSLAILCLQAERPSEAPRLGKLLSDVQLADGSWPSFVGDRESSWTTALAICALNSVGDPSKARERGESWLLRTKGQEGHWLWRWKFKTADRNVRFDPDKYGWPWVTGSASWVIPTAFSIIAIEQFTVCNRSEESEKRIHLGVEMLLDRACVDGGWNSGNSLVYGVPLRPHVEATAMALLALQDEQRTETVKKSLSWLRQNAASMDSVSSLAWCILTLFVYQEPIGGLRNRLATIIGNGRDIPLGDGKYTGCAYGYGDGFRPRPRSTKGDAGKGSPGLPRHHSRGRTEPQRSSPGRPLRSGIIAFLSQKSGGGKSTFRRLVAGS